MSVGEVGMMCAVMIEKQSVPPQKVGLPHLPYVLNYARDEVLLVWASSGHRSRKVPFFQV